MAGKRTQAHSKSEGFQFISISKLRIRQAKSLQNSLFRLYNKNSPREFLPRGFVVLLWPWRLIFFPGNQLFTQHCCLHSQRRISTPAWALRSLNIAPSVRTAWPCLNPPQFIPLSPSLRQQGHFALSVMPMGGGEWKARPLIYSFTCEFI